MCKCVKTWDVSIIILLASLTTILEIKIILKRIISLTSDEPPLRKYKIKIVNVYKGFFDAKLFWNKHLFLYRWRGHEIQILDNMEIPNISKFTKQNFFIWEKKIIFLLSLIKIRFKNRFYTSLAKQNFNNFFFKIYFQQSVSAVFIPI